MPINFHNSTRQNETLFQRNYTLDNSTEFVETNDTGISPFQMIISTQYLVSTGEKSPNQPDMIVRVGAKQCILPTCMTAVLGSSLQIGDEIAGSSTRDPQGIGKK
ncbi:uncharacterized protein zgc:193726 isoform X2 [Osmerus mordax]|uniref:uncharacterized protein zgc:193726 isoform X2 n=1 Tax=Osmerus mordax TaxID=8014 RepID=UPI00351069DF